MDFCGLMSVEPWFIEMFPYIERIRVTIPKGQKVVSLRHCSKQTKLIEIDLPANHTKKVLRRDILWCVATSLNPDVGHSPEWCLTFALLVKKTYSPKSCGELISLMKKYNVNYGPGGLVEEVLKGLRTTSTAMKLWPDFFRPLADELVIKEDRWTQGFALACAMAAKIHGPETANGILVEAGMKYRHLIEGGAEKGDLVAIKTGMFPL